MNALSLFDAEAYFKKLCDSNKLSRKHGFHFCTCAGLDSLEGPLAEFTEKNAFFCLSDTADGALARGRSGGWTTPRLFTVFILHRYEYGDMADRREKLSLCRSLFRQVAARLAKDEDEPDNEMVFLDTGSIKFREFGQYFLNGCTGIVFTIRMSEPTDLQYDPDLWII